MSNYLINPFCNLEVLYDFDPNVKHDILSCSFLK